MADPIRLRVLPSLLPQEVEFQQDGLDLQYRYVGTEDWVTLGQFGASVTIGTVSTLGPNDAATVVNVGTPQNAILDIGIPAGSDGLVQTIVEDDGVTVDNTDPNNPIVATDKPTQTEAETGTDAVKAVTPLRAAQLIDKRVARFGTRALAAASTPVAAPAFIETMGYTAAGDGGGALYKSVVAEPSHEAKLSITLADAVTVKWFEFVGDEINLFQIGAKGDDTVTVAGTDDTTAFTNAVAVAIALGVPLDIPSLPGGRMFRLASAVTINKGITVISHGVTWSAGGSANQSAPLFGSWLHIDHTGKGLVLYDSTNLNAGGWDFTGQLGIYRNQPAHSDAAWTPTANDFDMHVRGRAKIGELFCLKSTNGILVEGGVLTLDELHGQFFDRGIEYLSSTDTNRLAHVHAWPFWSQKAGPLGYSRANGVALFSNRCDDLHVDDFFSYGMKWTAEFDDTGSALGSATAAFTFGTLRSDNAGGALHIKSSDAANARGSYGHIDYLVINSSALATTSTAGVLVDGTNICRLDIDHVDCTRANAEVIKATGAAHRIDVGDCGMLETWNAKAGGEKAFKVDDGAIINFASYPVASSGTVDFAETSGQINLPNPTRLGAGTVLAGTTTPTMAFSTPGTSSFTYGTRSCEWRKVADRIFFELTMDFTPTIGTGSGAIRVNTLIPYVAASSPYASLNVSNMNASWTWGGRTHVAGEMPASTALISIVGSGSTLTASTFGPANLAGGASHTIKISGSYRAAL